MDNQALSKRLLTCPVSERQKLKGKFLARRDYENVLTTFGKRAGDLANYLDSNRFEEEILFRTYLESTNTATEDLLLSQMEEGKKIKKKLLKILWEK